MKDDKLLKLYEIMVTSRLLDLFCEEEFVKKGVNLRHYHSGIGQEALSVTGAGLLRETDYLYYTHRGVGSLLAKGVSLDAILRDMFFKVGGTNDGSGSVMHTYAPELGIVGRNGVFGSRFTIAAGLALSAKERNTKNVALCYYGEAAAARGMYYEALNMAVLWKLPVIYLAENNGFSVSSRTDEVYAPGNMSDMWRGFDIPVVRFDGNDMFAVAKAAEEAIGRARAGEGPSVLEGITYRISEHIPFEDHYAYREEAEIEEWRAKDPIPRAREELIARGIWSREKDEKLCTEWNQKIRDIYKEVEKAPIADRSEIYRKVYYE